MSTLRTFIAIELPPEMQEQIAQVQARLRRDTPEGVVRWVQPHGIHLTLKFLGDTPSDKITTIGDALKTVCAAHVPFTFAVKGLGCFPDSRRPRVVWVGVEETEGHLKRLQQAIEQAISPLGFPTEDRAFSPHLTLGRVKEGRGSDAGSLGALVTRLGAQVALGTVYVESVALIRSDLLPGGAVYTPLAHAVLGGGRR